MSSDATQVPSPEGLRFDQPTGGAGAPTCAQCQATIADAYYEVNGHVVCARCNGALVQDPAGSRASRVLRASLLGLGGAMVGAGIYYAILAATNMEIGLVAIVVGWLVGRGVQKGSGGRGGWAYQTLAVGLTYLAIVSTYIPFSFGEAGKKDVIRLIQIAVAAPFLAGLKNILGLVIISFALYQAWKMNRRTSLVVSGPYAVGAPAAEGAAGGE